MLFSDLLKTVISSEIKVAPESISLSARSDFPEPEFPNINAADIMLGAYPSGSRKGTPSAPSSNNPYALSEVRMYDYAVNEIGLKYEDYILTSEKYHRPNEVNYLLGDYTKAKTELGWSPETSFKDLVKLMVQSDLKLAEREKTLIENNLLVPTWEHSL